MIKGPKRPLLPATPPNEPLLPRLPTPLMRASALLAMPPLLALLRCGPDLLACAIAEPALGVNAVGAGGDGIREEAIAAVALPAFDKRHDCGVCC